MRRARTAGRHIGPGDGNEYVQIVDVKDVASLLVLAVEQGIVGDFNLTGRAMTFREFLQRCKSVTRSDAEFVWVPKDFLLDSAAAENDKYFPLWRPNPRVRAIFQTSSEKAFRRAGKSDRSPKQRSIAFRSSIRSTPQFTVGLIL